MTKLLINFKNVAHNGRKRQFFRKFSTLSVAVRSLPFSLLLLTGCDNLFEPTVAEICKDDPALCSDLNQDGWCRSEKATIIRLRHTHKDDKSEQYKYPLMLAFEDYLACVDKASGIEHIKYRDKEATRLKGVLTAQKELKRLSRETRHAADPYLSYYHWSRHGNKEALERFRQYMRSHDVQDPALLVFRAEEEVKRDLQRTTAILYEALSLYETADAVDMEIYHSLVSIALEQENYRLAYVWLKVTEYYDDEALTDSKTLMAARTELPFDVLDAVADEIISAINGGDFNADELQLARL
ncbi:DUF2989 domain-containing protein [Alteromonas halophila]|uniref:DUF2989 domain-containing protein n=1 Tax=Alteromonas halophila TaxID=516698 RepID=A0A918JGA6_9ALTE|nr:DUF2989 domain-containing protein [Alteromonas halophila]GGW77033.1 hypothetical protein GCM10007391_07420 [Alteromonas halophila]